MKKTFIIVATILCSVLSITSSYRVSTNNYNFVNYDLANSGINDTGTAVAFDKDNNIAYASDEYGLSIGTKNGQNYKFTNYPNQGKNTGSAVAFDNNGDVAYASGATKGGKGGLVIGLKNNNSYDFQSFGADKVNNAVGTAVAFDNVGDIAYTSEGGGLAIGIRESGNRYAFLDYDRQNTNRAIKSNYGTSVCFDSHENVLYTGYGNKGITIGTRTYSGTYTFKHYSIGLGGLIGNNIITSMTLDKNGALYCATFGAGILIGTPSQSGYSFSIINKTNSPRLATNFIKQIAINNNGEIALAGCGSLLANGYGLLLGKKVNGKYVFTTYNSKNTSAIKNDVGASVAFDHNGNVAYTGRSNGLTIGYL